MLALTVNGQVYRLTEMTELKKAEGSLDFYKVFSISETSQVSPIKDLMISCCFLIDYSIDAQLIVKIKGMASVKVEDVKLIDVSNQSAYYWRVQVPFMPVLVCTMCQ